MYEVKFDPQICEECETYECLVKCQYMDFDLKAAEEERNLILKGVDSRVLTDCLTCYACEEYCPYDNHPFYHLVDLQEEKGLLPAPDPITKQQIIMMQPRGGIQPAKLDAPIIDMCAFPMLMDCIRGKLFEGASTFAGTDVFCNVMWLHFAKNSVIRERLPRVIDTIWNKYLKESGVDEIVCFHDECYGTYTHLAPAFGIDVPFKSVHLFDHLYHRLVDLKDEIRPLNAKVAYQRPCSNRLIPETQHWVDDIFGLIGADRVEREYDRDTPLCCGAIPRTHQQDLRADDIVKRNIDDMERVGAEYCVFNCQACFFNLSSEVEERGIKPILMSDLCQLALEPEEE
ncbi:MAG: (Fe-S)-binding protein [Proteobacteria bacterium]|nr:(Fe-S)-binding protein [Pseudomonadota bacterium]